MTDFLYGTKPVTEHSFESLELVFQTTTCLFI